MIIGQVLFVFSCTAY